jgi:Topoisomerase IA
MKLILAEKPELAEDIAKAIMSNYKTISKGHYINDEYVCISSFGHILELAEPEFIDERLANRNDINLLPIYFKNWKKVPSKEPYKRKRLSEIEKYIDKVECIIHAGDPDDEGQLLIDEILEYFHYAGKEYRVFVNDNISKNIQKAFKNMKENDRQEKNNGLAAFARQMADKAEGINDSRLANIRLKTGGLSIGRVQTPTLALIVNRDLEIENHIKEKYYTLQAIYHLQKQNEDVADVSFSFKPNKEILDDDKYIKDYSLLENISKKLTKEMKISIEESDVVESPPLPYSLNTLSSEMNERYGYSSAKTLSITQSLRDKHKAITYNRSDSEYLKEEHYKNAPKLLSIIFENINKEYPVDTQKKSKCFNDKNAPTHHAIIPQEKQINIDDLSEEEKKVYLSICDRYIMQFLPDILKKKKFASFHLEEGMMSYTDIKVTDYGYKKYFSSNEQCEKESPDNGIYNAFLSDVKISEEETKPKKRYTEGTLIKDMCNVSKYVSDPHLKMILKKKDEGKKGENGSIGTVATRGSIIEILKKREFIEEKGKYLISTQLGRDFIKIIPEELKSADLTAKWWMLQELVRVGKRDPNIVMMSVVEEFNKRKETAFTNVILEKKEDIVCKCPKCGGNIYKRKGKEKQSYYVCENHKNGCSIIINEKIKYFDNTFTLTDKKISALFKGDNISLKVKNKQGDKYNSLFKLEIIQKDKKTYLNLVRVKER